MIMIMHETILIYYVFHRMINSMVEKTWVGVKYEDTHMLGVHLFTKILILIDGPTVEFHSLLR